MSKITKEKVMKDDLKANLTWWLNACQKPRGCEKHCTEDAIRQCRGAENIIRSLIENMDKKPKVSREFVQRWADKFSPDKRFGLQGERAINYLWWREKQIISMLTELGHGVEGKGGDE